MSTEENDKKLSRHLQEAFHSFEPEPPPSAWPEIREKIPGHKAEDSWQRFREQFLEWFRQGYRLYPVYTAIGLLLVLVVVWLSVRQSSHQIKGTAYVEGEALSRGAVSLFHVKDRQPPLDSVRFCRKLQLDPEGNFLFQNVSPGTYFIRAHLHEDAPGYPEYRFGYSGDQLSWHDAELIDTENLREHYRLNIPKLAY